MPTAKQRLKGLRTGGESLNQKIIACQHCERLIKHCQNIGLEKRAAYQEQTYWARPVPNFGSLPAPLLLVGLAPGAHGANRTGRMFTGDQSGRWLYRALFRAGFANQESWESADDGLELLDCAITAVNHCAPPDNKPTTTEIQQCQPFLLETFQLSQPRVIVALGQIAWHRSFDVLKILYQLKAKRPAFSHSAIFEYHSGQWLIGSYHPSQQNTFTGRLTEEMLDAIFQIARSKLAE